MRYVILVLCFILVPVTVFAQTTVPMSIHAVIYNLTQMPIEEAMQFCKDRVISCPNIEHVYYASNRGIYTK